ncbi:MAG: hypothetical protein A2Y93_07250 [Chloroflexi bacterium RBG_13_68_17]|nr:MAG: hypothetical protein A2Y93_07250 [Chloroflexi bacterium RBG_13_68_17]
METARSPVDLVRAIDAAIEETAHLAGMRPVAIVAEYPAHLPAVVGDATVLPKVLSSLLSLALLGAEQREVRVRAALVEADEAPGPTTGAPGESPLEGPWVRVIITGAGRISDDVPANGAADAAGDFLAPTGDLGACRQILEDLGGRLWTDDPGGRGVRLNLLLPVHGAVEAEADRFAVRRVVEARLPEGDRGSRTLLVIVENSDLGDMLSADLTSAGYRVVVAGNGRDSLTIARRLRPDMILLDLTLRDPSPLELAMLFKYDRRTSGLPVLFLTVVGDPRSGGRVGTVNFLVRQPGTGSLLAAIHALESAGTEPSARVLVVEPEDALRSSMLMMIQAYGYRVTEAREAVEALALAERLRPAQILVNARLAQEQDFWLLRNLRQTCVEAGIFVLADGLSDADGQAAVRRGASGYSDTGKLNDLLDRVRDKPE